MCYHHIGFKDLMKLLTFHKEDLWCFFKLDDEKKVKKEFTTLNIDFIILSNWLEKWLVENNGNLEVKQKNNSRSV